MAANGQHSINISLTVGGETYSGVTTVADTAPDVFTQVSFAESVAASQTNEEHGLLIDVSKLQSVFILSDQDVTLKFCDSGSPTPTMALKANLPYVWVTGKSLDSCLLTVDITKVYITTGAAVTLVRIEALMDNSAP